MTEDRESIWENCNCMNCRLARIEDNINKIVHIIDNLPVEFGESPDEVTGIKKC
jgi:hypothetical protein